MSGGNHITVSGREDSLHSEIADLRAGDITPDPRHAIVSQPLFHNQGQ
jgi:hypothetical protein